ncbi:MAG: carboxymuconolactone decarboxylase family protein [Bacteroides sp.]|nr:carboxymuconolactone decarboxylase family protein [Bacteroides sp.]
MKSKGIILMVTGMTIGFIHSLYAQDMQHTFTLRQQRIATIATTTATGDLTALRSELTAGLEAGLTTNEIKEILIQMYAYCGFPRSLQGINTFMVLMEERQAAGLTDIAGEEPATVAGKHKYAQGKQTLEQLTGRHEAGPTGANAFVPSIDTFLKEHLFADIFGRGVLSHTDRELATVSALIGLGGVDPMLQSHLDISRHVGLSEEQLRQAIETVAPFVGTEKAEHALQILAGVAESR